MVPETSQTELAAAHADGRALVVDVREAREYRTGHVPGARNLPLSVLPLHLTDLPRQEPVHVICQSGARSAQAAAMMRSVGIDARNVVGGTGAWVAARRPLSTPTSAA